MDDAGQAQSVWATACREAGFELEVFAANDASVQPLTRKLGLNTYPALLQADQIIAIGTPDPARARQILAGLGRAGRG